jgi:tetratricopeptide (TPR) repeat protein
MLRTRLIWTATIALTAAALAAPSATAQAPTKDHLARDHFGAGRAYFEAGRYEEAAKQFEEAYRLSQRPALLSNIFRSYERLGDVAKAESAYQRYRESDPDASDLQMLELRLESMRARAARGVSDHDEAKDRQPPARAPAQDEHRKEAPSDAAPADDVGAADADSRDSPGVMQYAGYGLLGLAGASAVIALATGLRANGLYGDLDSACPDRACDPNLRSTADKGQSLAVVSTVFTGVAVASAVVGAVLWLLGRNRREEASPTDRARVQWTSGPGLAGLGARVTY